MSYSQSVDQGYLSFARGLVTEYNPLQAPEGTTSDELNMDVDMEGMVRVRREPFLENSRHNISGVRGRLVVSEHWNDIGRNIFLLELEEDPLEPDKVRLSVVVTPDDGSNGVDITISVEVDKQVYVQPTISFTRKRAVIIVGGLPLILEKGATSYNLYNVNILVRDFKLLDGGINITQRPSTMPSGHLYNLYNAGWWQHRKLDSGGKPVGDPVNHFHTVRGVYPSNADVSYLGDTTDADGDLVFTPTTYDNIDIGSTEAPRGHYIFSIRNIDRQSRVTNKNNDGSGIGSLISVVDDGADPETGDPIDPGTPWEPPGSGWCDPDTGVCTDIP